MIENDKEDEQKSRIWIIILAILLIFVLLISSFSFVQYNKFRKAISAEQEDICQTPPGYTDQAWREHMGHHPDRYARCLGKV